jgi:acyl-coenzyme A thioesterase PaaI-like protein
MPDKPTREQLDKYARQFNESATMRHFGVTLSFPSAGEVRADLPIQPEQRGGLGREAVNGGVLAAMFDLVIGCTPALIDVTRANATMQLSMSFERPVLGSRLYVLGRIDRPGAAVLFSSAVLYDEKGEACARCQGLVRISSKPWASGESPAVN